MTGSLLRDTARSIRHSIGRYLAILCIVMLGVGFYAGLEDCEDTLVTEVNRYFSDRNLYDFVLFSTWGFSEDEEKKLDDSDVVLSAEGAYYVDVLATCQERKDIDQTAQSFTTIEEDSARPVEGESVGGESGEAGSAEVESGTVEEKTEMITATSNDNEPISEDDQTVSIDGESHETGELDVGSFVLRIRSITEKINQLELINGRMPENEDECLADPKKFSIDDIGKEITILEENTSDTMKLLKEHELTIVGIARSVLYLSDERGTSSVGSGQIDAYLYVPKTIFDSEYYYEVFVDCSLEGRIYSDEYNEEADVVEEEVKQEGRDVQDERYKKTVQDFKASPLLSLISGMGDQDIEDVDLRNGGADEDDSSSFGGSSSYDISSIIDIDAYKYGDSFPLPEEPEITVLRRDENLGYAAFENDSTIVSAIAQVFPFFFFLVASLVCATTMTRMIAEERTQIGIWVSTGYSTAQVEGKYMVYSGSAGAIGSALGFIIGTKLLPIAIYTGYKAAYFFPDSLCYVFHPKVLIGSILVSLLCTMGITFVKLYADIRQMPAMLIRPRSPKAGKRVFLEKIGPVWRRLSFLRKISIRNLLRYKGRSMMMILGISGCGALLVAGFGIRDSFASLSEKQYTEVTIYDAKISFRKELTKKQRDAFTKRCTSLITQNGVLFLNSHSGTVTSLAKSEDVTVVSILFDEAELETVMLETDGEALENTLGTLPLETEEAANNAQNLSVASFINLRQTQITGNLFRDLYMTGTISSEELSIPGDGEILLDRGLAHDLNVETGDIITLKSGEKQTSLRISGVYENYLWNCAYVSQGTMEEIWGDDPQKAGGAYVILNETKDVYSVSASLLADDDVTSVQLSEDNIRRFQTSMNGLDFIITVVVLCAGALSFIVIYNLTNINITERLREIATLKVLGFYDKETNSYIFRDNVLLAHIGALLGLFLGKLLHAFIILQLPLNRIAVDYEITWRTYIVSFALTELFSYLMQLVMRRKIYRIKMAESLKSVE